MPTRRVKTVLSTTAAVGACAALMVPSAASAARGSTSSSAGCSLPATAQVFSAFGDSSHYYLASGGAFESLTWSKVGAPSLIVQNEPFKLAGARHKYSVQLESGEAVTSPRFCISQDQPHLRFVARALGEGQLDVQVDTYGSNGEIVGSSSGSISPSDHVEWAPTRFVSLNTSSMGVGQSAFATLTISSQGDWLVDDVFIDPYRR